MAEEEGLHSKASGAKVPPWRVPTWGPRPPSVPPPKHSAPPPTWGPRPPSAPPPKKPTNPHWRPGMPDRAKYRGGRSDELRKERRAKQMAAKAKLATLEEFDKQIGIDADTAAEFSVMVAEARDRSWGLDDNTAASFSELVAQASSSSKQEQFEEEKSQSENEEKEQKEAQSSDENKEQEQFEEEKKIL